MEVVVMGIGFCGSFPASGGLSYRELIARAASMAYEDAGLAASEIDGAVSVEEDFNSGYSIADEYVPDQIGMARKPIYTICGDFLHGIASAVMQIRTGQFKTLVVEAYSKASNVLTKDEVLHFAYDPAFGRLGVTPHYLAGIEMQHFLGSSAYSPADVAEVVVANRSAAIGNALAPYGARLGLSDVLGARPVATPVTELMIARPADAAVVAVLGAADAATNARRPVRIAGTGWASGNSIIEHRNHAYSSGSMIAARMAYSEAGLKSPAEECGVFYVSDIYAHRQLMHIEALGITKDALPFVNPDGGALGSGDMYEATGGARFFDAVKMLRGEAGAHQLEGVARAAVHGWRGLPTDSCAVAVLEATE
ncbi:MAG: acetyl-CoA acetyltransferase [Deltaproteobacteria bacterium]|nr:acetyl-CoA acetyltransferase [Deltaproteobacteria bacterium]